MTRFMDIFEYLMSSRRLSWATLFAVGLLSGVLLGLATGLPVTGKVIAGSAPLASIMPERPPARTIDLSARHERANRQPPSAPTPVAERTDRAVPQLASGDMVVPIGPASRKPRPKIAIVIDDLGFEREAFDRVNNFSRPVTLAFLPYGEHAQEMIDAAEPQHEIIMHLPMEPIHHKDQAGPDMLKSGASTTVIKATLAKNLAKLHGYDGVNNHTGSQFTADPVGMAVVLEELTMRDLFFLDSLTTKDRVAKKIAAGTDWRVLERDVFLDGEWPDVSVTSVKDQLAELEAIAKRRGYAIGIAHPYEDTVDTLGPWILTAKARGFDLVTVGDLMPQSGRGMALAKLR